MNVPEDAISEEDWELEEDAINRLRRFVAMAVDDPSEKKRIKVSYTGAHFFGDFYITKETLQRALK